MAVITIPKPSRESLGDEAAYSLTGKKVDLCARKDSIAMYEFDERMNSFERSMDKGFASLERSMDRGFTSLEEKMRLYFLFLVFLLLATNPRVITAIRMLLMSLVK